ncbi:MAG: TIGR01620 family protein [Proteobacteria bacterium]|nr:TIGR01620 family protein [Pseudomonadota bacterium]
MTATQRRRQPASFALDDPEIVVASAAAPTPTGAGSIVVMPAPDPDPLAQREAALVAPTLPRLRGIAWGGVFWSALGGLVLLAASLAATRAIEDLFARAPWLGALGLTLAAIAGLALGVLLAREVLAILRLRTLERLRSRAIAVLTNDDRAQGLALVRDILALTRPAPQLARARARIEGHLDDIIDGADLVRLAERELMAPLDAQARRLVATAARRVSIVTAVSPRALLDMAFVFANALRLMRRLAELYGGRPGMLGQMRLMRQVLAHLAFTGGMAIGEGLVQQVIGHGLSAKLSARLGEGVLNGLLTARLGLAAIDIIRPLPFAALERPAFGDIAGALMRWRENSASTAPG